MWVKGKYQKEINAPLLYFSLFCWVFFKKSLSKMYKLWNFLTSWLLTPTIVLLYILLDTQIGERKEEVQELGCVCVLKAYRKIFDDGNTWPQMFGANSCKCGFLNSASELWARAGVQRCGMLIILNWVPKQSDRAQKMDIFHPISIPDPLESLSISCVVYLSLKPGVGGWGNRHFRDGMSSVTNSLHKTPSLLEVGSCKCAKWHL